MDFGDLPDDLADDDRLFRVRGPSQFDTKMAWTFLRDYRYVEGFRRAAEALGSRSSPPAI